MRSILLFVFFLLPTPVKLLTRPKEAVAVWLVVSSCETATRTKEAVAVWLVVFSCETANKNKGGCSCLVGSVLL